MPIQKITPSIISSVTGLSVANTDISGTITGSQVSSNTLANTVFQTGSVENYMNAAGLGFGMRNRIINGAMVIDQRNAGASVTINSAAWTYVVDRFCFLGQSADGVFTAQQSSTAPAGFTKSLLVTVTTADSSIGAGQIYTLRHTIEGYNIADLNWGSANAQSVTLSFWVRSSVTGTFSGCFNNEGTASYPFTYTINSANTWEQKTVTVTGPTSGTWGSTNSNGIRLTWSLGVGSTYSGTANTWNYSTEYFAASSSTNLIATNGATFYITGVQLEKGSTATSFDYRPYSAELAMCQRYYYLHASGSISTSGMGFYYNSAFVTGLVSFPVAMRVVPTLVHTTGTNYYGIYSNNTLDTFDSFNAGIAQPSTQNCGIEVSTGVSGTAGNAGRVVTYNASASIAFNSEL